MTRKLIKIGAAVLTTILALVLLWQFRLVVIYVLISLMLAAALRPLVARLAGKRFLVRLAWILLYLVILAGFGILLFLTVETAVIEIQHLSETLSVQDKWVLPVWLEGTSFQQIMNSRLPPPSKLFLAVTGEKGQLVLPAILGFSQGMGVVISAVMVILFLSIYWTINQVHFERLWLSLLPSDMRQKGAWCLEDDRTRYWVLHSRRGHPQPAGRAYPWCGLRTSGIPVPCPPGFGWSIGMPGSSGGGSPGDHSSTPGGVVDQPAAWRPHRGLRPGDLHIP